MDEALRARARDCLDPVEFREFTDVLEGVRPLMRTVCAGDRAAGLREAADALGLAFGESRCAARGGGCSGGVVQTLKPVSRQPPGAEDTRLVYVGADETVVGLAAVLDLADGRRFGRLAGYPDCCIDFFAAHFTQEHSDVVFDVAPPRGSRYEPLVNRTCRPFGAALISYFPCRWDCPRSLALAQRSLDALRKHDPGLAAAMAEGIAQDVVYAPQAVFAIRETVWRDGRLVLSPGEYVATGGLEADTIAFDGDRAVARAGRREIVRMAPVRWLPFQSQTACPSTEDRNVSDRAIS